MSTTSSPAPAWIYLDIARAVEQVGDTQTLRSMLPMLQEMLERDLPQISQLLAAGDVRGANGLLHSLKGCMPIFCVQSLCEHLADVERLSKTGGSAEVEEAFSGLSPHLSQLQAEVVRYLGQPM